MTYSHTNHDCISVNGFVYVIGGQGPSIKSEVFDIPSWSWSDGPPHPNNADAIAGIKVIPYHGTIASVGGQQVAPTTANLNVYQLNIGTGQWTQIGPNFNTGRYRHSALGIYSGMTNC